MIIYLTGNNTNPENKRSYLIDEIYMKFYNHENIHIRARTVKQKSNLPGLDIVMTGVLFNGLKASGRIRNIYVDDIESIEIVIHNNMDESEEKDLDIINLHLSIIDDQDVIEIINSEGNVSISRNI